MQAEHPWLKVWCEKDAESGDGVDAEIIENVQGKGGPCHLYGGGAPREQINTRACGQASQTDIEPNLQARLVPSQATNLEPARQDGLVPSQASKETLAKGEPMEEIKTLCGTKMRNAKYINNIVCETIVDARIYERMPVSCQIEMGSLRERVLKSNVMNGVIGQKETKVKSLKTTIEKNNYKIFKNLSKTLSSKTLNSKQRNNISSHLWAT